jgi:nucleotide-binding universal stress UspA family protein
MFRKILLPLDGSDSAEQALFWAKEYARPSKAQVVLLQVLPTEYPLKGLPFRAGSDEARHYLQGIERELNYAGIPSRTLLRSDPASRTIAATAKTEGCDLIIMTSRGASKALRWLIGGVTDQVMRLSQVPLLIVRSRIAAAVHQRPRRIVLPQDGSSLARGILPWAKRLARFHRVPVVLLHVPPSGTQSPRSAASSRVGRELSRQARLLRASGIKALVLVAEGDPAEEILRACRPADLLALTTHGHGGFKRLLLGSVAEKILHQASVPVLIYKKRTKTRRLPYDLAAMEFLDR